MTAQKPSLGRVVLTRVDPAMNNGSDIAPAIITRVWNDHLGPEHWMVNIRVQLDAFTMPLWATSVKLLDAEPAADAQHVAWWPPRV